MRAVVAGSESILAMELYPEIAAASGIKSFLHVAIAYLPLALYSVNHSLLNIAACSCL